MNCKGKTNSSGDNNSAGGLKFCQHFFLISEILSFAIIENASFGMNRIENCCWNII
jgi:hypothetical protein